MEGGNGMAAVLGDLPLRFVRPRLGGAADSPERMSGGRRRHPQIGKPLIRSRNLASGACWNSESAAWLSRYSRRARDARRSQSFRGDDFPCPRDLLSRIDQQGLSVESILPGV